MRNNTTLDKKVLILEDEIDLREIYDCLLNKKGYQTVHAGAVDEAILYLNKYSFGLCIVDYRMACGGSTELFCRHVKEKVPELPLLMVSGKERNSNLYDVQLFKGECDTKTFIKTVVGLYESTRKIWSLF